MSRANRQTPDGDAGTLLDRGDSAEPTSLLSKGWLQPGSRIHQYELIRKLESGGMGHVWLARDIKLGRRVAMKFLSRGSESFTQRFLTEARATARCNHENIVVIYEADEYQGSPYMVLEFLEGSSLSKLCKGSALPPSRAVELAVPVVRALLCAHEFNIVHRDLKPANIFVTDSGVVKVLDFGIAKVFSDKNDSGSEQALMATQEFNELTAVTNTAEGALLGTMLYMSPEQWGIDHVDHRTDLWAVGVVLYQLIAGKHPFAGFTQERLLYATTSLDAPMPDIRSEVPVVSAGLAALIARCLAKRKSDRYQTAAALLEDLEKLLPGRYGRQLSEGESPYPGLSAFQESDADRFFGRSRDVVHLKTKLREVPIVGVLGSSGVGKSSFVRAGVVPTLRSSGEAWETFTIRPGRNPMASLARLLQAMNSNLSSDVGSDLVEQRELSNRLGSEPGFVGAMLRRRARETGSKVLLFIDQFEELYTLVADAAQRAAFTACLSAAADDSASPVRIIVAMRSDLLHRIAEDQRFMHNMMSGMMVLRSPDRRGLREALTEPLEIVGHSFETMDIVDNMLDALEATPGALPLLQFAAAQLWSQRDCTRRMITKASYDAMGGIVGTLATHADAIIGTLAPPALKIVRSIFLRLVTPEGTRAIADLSELLTLAPDAKEVQQLVEYLVSARLLVVRPHNETDESILEIVHESLISSWPKLRRWLDEAQGDTAFLAHLRAAAKQWDNKGRPQGLLWRNEAMEEARHWYRRYTGKLPKRDHEYLKSVLELANRTIRRRRATVVTVIGVLSALVVVAVFALLWIRDAEQTAQRQKLLAETEAARASAAERKVNEQLEELQKKEHDLRETLRQKEEADQKLADNRQQLSQTQEDYDKALRNQKSAQYQAKNESERARLEEERAKRIAQEKRELENVQRDIRAKYDRLRKKEKERKMKQKERRNRIITSDL